MPRAHGCAGAALSYSAIFGIRGLIRLKFVSLRALVPSCNHAFVVHPGGRFIFSLWSLRARFISFGGVRLSFRWINSF